MTWRNTLLWFVMIGVGLLHPEQLGAEPPTREDMQFAPILMRKHLIQIADYGGWPTPYISADGIWRLEPDGERLTVLRRFTATGLNPGSTDNFFLGNQGFLTVKGDRVLFQAHPHDFNFDALSWKMVNRLPVANGEASGSSPRTDTSRPSTIIPLRGVSLGCSIAVPTA